MKNLLVLAILMAGFLVSCVNDKTTKVMNENPFFSEWTTPHGVPPFNLINDEHFIPAFEKAIEIHDKEIDDIVKNTEVPTFVNTIVALDVSGKDLGKVSGVFFNLAEANTNDEITRITGIIAPKLANHNDNIMLNKELFKRVKHVYDEQEKIDMEVEIGNARALNKEQKALLDETYKSFVRGGSELNDTDQEKLRKINERLAILYPEFGNILLNEINDYYMLIEDENELSGLPESVKSAAAEVAVSVGHEGAWAFTLNKPSWIPFLQYSDNRDRREELYTAWMDRGKTEAYNTTPLINEILVLREEKAKLLGFHNFAEYNVSKNMAKTPDKVYC